jgi:uncharacterized membrane protein YphA (DoxX/SURF4 family)
MASKDESKAKYYGFWAYKAIIALAFLFFGTLKLISAPMLVQEFNVIGLGQGFRYFTGLVEVGGAILLIYPKTFRYGAPLLLAVSIGAFVAQATRLHEDVIHTLVLIAATGFLVWTAWKPGARARTALV